MTYEDNRDFCIRWGSGWATNDSRCNYPEFKYLSAEDLQTGTKFGRLNTYTGGGYVIRMQGTAKKIIERMSHLQVRKYIQKYIIARMKHIQVRKNIS